MPNLVQSHRSLGYEIERITRDGRELVVLHIEASPRPVYDVTQAIKVQLTPTLDAELAVAAELAILIDRAQFLGLDVEALRRLLDKELSSR